MATQIVSSAQLRELASQLQAGGHGVLLKELRKAVRDAGKPVVEDVRAAWLRMTIRGDQGSAGVLAPTRGGGRNQRIAHASQRITNVRLAEKRYGGLRQSVASATRGRSLSRGYTIEVDQSKFPDNWKNLPQSLESRRGWRHPLFGDRENWYAERGGPTFYPTCRRNQPRFHEAVAAARDRAAQKLAERVGSV